MNPDPSKDRGQVSFQATIFLCKEKSGLNTRNQKVTRKSSFAFFFFFPVWRGVAEAGSAGASLYVPWL